MNYKENLLTQSVKEKLTLEEIEYIYNKVEEITSQARSEAVLSFIDNLETRILNNPKS